MMQFFPRAVLLTSLALFGVSDASADSLETRIITTPRITVADVVPNAPAAVREIDLGPAPAPGASRLIAKDEIVRTLNRSGIFATFPIAISTRVLRKKEHFTGHALMELSRGPITAELPAGVTLSHLETPLDVDAPAGTRLEKVTLPKLPKQKGAFHTTVKLTLTAGEEHVAEIPIGVVFDIDEAAAQHDVKKGTRVMVIVERESLRVSVEGVLARDADIGDLTQVSIVSTGRPLRVKLLTKTTSQLAEDR